MPHNNGLKDISVHPLQNTILRIHTVNFQGHPATMADIPERVKTRVSFKQHQIVNSASELTMSTFTAYCLRKKPPIQWVAGSSRG
jgi:hypothetical protein